MARRNSFDAGPQAVGWGRLLLMLAGLVVFLVGVSWTITKIYVDMTEKSTNVRIDAVVREVDQLRSSVLGALSELRGDMKEVLRRTANK